MHIFKLYLIILWSAFSLTYHASLIMSLSFLPIYFLVVIKISFAFFFFLPFFFYGHTSAYGSSLARDQIGVTAAGLSHSHSNAGYEPQL